jgi:hypothetical protein
MPKCFQFPRLVAEDWEFFKNPDKWAWISVGQPDYRGHSYEHVVNECLDKLNSLKIKFWDLEEPCPGNPGDEETLYPPSALDAKQIVDFIKDNEGKNFIVNCEAGISRSGAICLFLEQCLSYNWPEITKKFAYPSFAF